MSLRAPLFEFTCKNLMDEYVCMSVRATWVGMGSVGGVKFRVSERRDKKCMGS